MESVNTTIDILKHCLLVFPLLLVIHFPGYCCFPCNVCFACACSVWTQLSQSDTGCINTMYCRARGSKWLAESIQLLPSLKPDCYQLLAQGHPYHLPSINSSIF